MIRQIRRGVRPGITLLEVLTAIFIMGIGLLAILTLFPLGALSMARAVRDDRAATIAANGASLAVAHDLRNDSTVAAYLAAAPPNYTTVPDGPGYPVFVDPAYAAFSPNTQWLPGMPLINVLGASSSSPGVPRIAPSYAPSNSQAAARWFTFLDEMPFEKTGEPKGVPPVGLSVTRPATYSFAYLLRRPRPASPEFTELTVIVYAGRATDAVGGETVCPVSGGGSATTNTIQVTYTGDKPNFRKGGWVLDTSFRQIGGTAGTGTVNGYFYQVAAVTDTLTANGSPALTLELETTLKENVTTLVLLDNVITVLERGTAWRP
jgi:hypothetical protein